MIEVISAVTSGQAKTGSDAETSKAKIELLAAAADFFADRLLTHKQQKHLSFFIEFTTKPLRGSISLDMLASKTGVFGLRPPRRFKMTLSLAVGMRAALDTVAVEMVHIAQVMSERLEIFAKKRKIGGQRETALKARWLGNRAIFIDALPRADRAWVTEAEVTSKQLVGEFLAWSSGRIRSVPRQRPKRNKIGLYRVRPTKIEVPASIQIWSDKEEETVMVPLVSGAESPFSEPSQTGVSRQNFSSDIVPADLDPPQMAEFIIYVEVPLLGTTRRLNSGAFHGKLNDLYERGVIALESVRAAMRLADDRRRQLR
ncbi:hypothetical protein N9X39_04940 [Alphaproteobacteria bacterium]|nr:hypothetical protein [Alphaproteobacteria bacterium]